MPQNLEALSEFRFPALQPDAPRGNLMKLWIDLLTLNGQECARNLW
jgi:hypothetical protein